MSTPHTTNIPGIPFNGHHETVIYLRKDSVSPGRRNVFEVAGVVLLMEGNNEGPPSQSFS